MRSHPMRATILGALAAASCAGSFGANLDITPPVLLSFKPEAVADATLPSGGFSIDLKASDDLSGIQWIHATAVGPDGTQMAFSGWEYSAGKTLSRSLHLDGLWTYQRPGTYTFVSARLLDAASNAVDYDQAALAALGATSFTVKNKGGFDATPPRLVSGKVLTPTLSASAVHPGTEQAAKAGVEIVAVDAGNTAISGVGYVSLDFCVISGEACFSLFSRGLEFKPVPDPVKLRLGASVSVPPGDYRLRTVGINDQANNSLVLTSTEFGGTTDFSAYFPSVVITVTP